MANADLKGRKINKENAAWATKRKRQDQENRKALEIDLKLRDAMNVINTI